MVRNLLNRLLVLVGCCSVTFVNNLSLFLVPVLRILSVAVNLNVFAMFVIKNTNKLLMFVLVANLLRRGGNSMDWAIKLLYTVIREKLNDLGIFEFRYYDGFFVFCYAKREFILTLTEKKNK